MQPYIARSRYPVEPICPTAHCTHSIRWTRPTVDPMTTLRAPCQCALICNWISLFHLPLRLTSPTPPVTGRRGSYVIISLLPPSPKSSLTIRHRCIGLQALDEQEHGRWCELGGAGAGRQPQRRCVGLRAGARHCAPQWPAGGSVPHRLLRSGAARVNRQALDSLLFTLDYRSRPAPP